VTDSVFNTAAWARECGWQASNQLTAEKCIKAVDPNYLCILCYDFFDGL
jgi:hypothetical protein